MAKVINITDKLDYDKPKVVVGEKEYEVNNTIEAVLKFEENMGNANTVEGMQKVLEISLGKEAAKDFTVKENTVKNFRTLTIAILAAMQDVEYEEAEKRFQNS